jgi:hypothetical protein
MRLIMIAAFFLGLGTMLHGQVTTGTVHGKTTDILTGEVIPRAKVWIESEGKRTFALADTAGRYKIDGVMPGIYTVYALSSGYDTSITMGVKVSPDALTGVDLKMSGKSTGTVLVYWVAPIVDPNIPRIKIPTEYIEQSSQIRNPLALLAGYSSEIQLPEGGGGQVIIRGSRPGDAVYYIDGVKMTDMSAVPGVAIGGLEAYTGGIPAKYGDTTGGVIILETKSYFDLYNAWLVGQ